MTTTFKPEDTRPFNLEHARKGAPYSCKNGDKATIFKFDCNGHSSLAGIVSSDRSDFSCLWGANGACGAFGNNKENYNLVMLPIGYVDGRPVHVGDVLINGKHHGKPTPDHEFTFTVGPVMTGRLLDCFWPYVEADEDEPKQEAKQEPEIVYTEPIPDRVIDSLIPSGLHVHDSAYGLLYEFAQNVNNEAFARFEVALVVGNGNPGAVIEENLKAPITPVLVDTSKAPPVAIPLKDDLPQQLALKKTQNRLLTEANTALEDLNRSYLEDNAKLEAMHNDQIAETGRWMAEAKKLGDQVEALTDKLNDYRNRVDELNSRISMIAAYVRNDAAAVTFQNMSSYRAAVLSKVLD